MDPVGSLNPRSLLLGSEGFQVRQVHADCKVGGGCLISFLHVLFLMGKVMEWA